MRLLFVCGDAEYLSTGSKVWRLVARLKRDTGYDIVGVTNEANIADEARVAGIECLLYSCPANGVTVADRVASIDQMITSTKHIVMPGTTLPLWKLLAQDDFAGSMWLHGGLPTVWPACDGVIAPLLSMADNTRGGCGLTVWAVAGAQKRGLPILALECGVLGGKQAMSATLPASAVAVKGIFSQRYLSSVGVTAPIALMSPIDAYLLSTEPREIEEAFLRQEQEVRQLLGIDRKQTVIVIPHHVTFLWETRQLLRMLREVFRPYPYCVVIDTDVALVRRQYTEPEMVERLYKDELADMPHVVINSQIGKMLLIQIADLVVATQPTQATQWAVKAGIPVTYTQAAGLRAWENLTTCWEPEPEAVGGVIKEWMQQGYIRQSLAAMLGTVLSVPKGEGA